MSDAPGTFAAEVVIHPDAAVADIDRRLFGSFVEHLGRCVYTGIYEPGHPTADADGFRQDVIDLVRELGVSTIRYPGGNFVSGYQWEDGIGPVEDRPRRLDLAWHSTETNEVGLHEFATWLEKVDSELMYAVNLGTRGVREALDVLEYANLRSGTAWTDLRAAHGRTEPFGIGMWCLGNEMDGPWQLGHRTAEEYASIASRTARAMRRLDPSVELVVCGSSSSTMPTFGSWERTVLEKTYDDVDHISCHAYYEPRDGDLDSYLASAVDMDRFIDAVAATADHVRAELGSDKTMYISFDEWNVARIEQHVQGEQHHHIDDWPVAPRVLEDVYDVLDAVVFGSLVSSLLRHADRVRCASLAQLVNAIAPIMTEPGGPAWRQTTFFPFAEASRLARGRSLRVEVTTPSHDTAAYGAVPVLDAAATHDPDTGAAAVFLVNRSRHQEAVVTIRADALGEVRASAVGIHDRDLSAVNSRSAPDRVGLSTVETSTAHAGTIQLTLPPVSWTAVELSPGLGGGPQRVQPERDLQLE
jgi:alpha-L-arabinofuranosidase